MHRDYISGCKFFLHLDVSFNLAPINTKSVNFWAAAAHWTVDISYQTLKDKFIISCFCSFILLAVQPWYSLIAIVVWNKNQKVGHLLLISFKYFIIYKHCISIFKKSVISYLIISFFCSFILLATQPWYNLIVIVVWNKNQNSVFHWSSSFVVNVFQVFHNCKFYWTQPWIHEDPCVDPRGSGQDP